MADRGFAGVIYVLTNPSFPEYVKIGYTSDLDERLKQLNRSECVPFAFRPYATYAVLEPLQDRELHALIDRLNPELRAVERYDGKTRVKEFYAMSAEDAYALLESIAKLSGTEDRLCRVMPDEGRMADEAAASMDRDSARERRSPFSFGKCGIPVGSEIVLIGNPDVKASVLDDRRILCEDETGELLAGTLSSFARMHLGVDRPVRGTSCWEYMGMSLAELRRSREMAGEYV